MVYSGTAEDPPASEVAIFPDRDLFQAGKLDTFVGDNRPDLLIGKPLTGTGHDHGDRLGGGPVGVAHLRFPAFGAKAHPPGLICAGRKSCDYTRHRRPHPALAPTAVATRTSVGNVKIPTLSKQRTGGRTALTGCHHHRDQEGNKEPGDSRTSHIGCDWNSARLSVFHAEKDIVTIFLNGMAESAESTSWGNASKRRLLASLAGLALVLGMVAFGAAQPVGEQSPINGPAAVLELP